MAGRPCSVYLGISAVAAAAAIGWFVEGLPLVGWLMVITAGIGASALLAALRDGMSRL